MIIVSGCNQDGKLMDIDGNVLFDNESRGMAVWRGDLYVAMGYKPTEKDRGLYRVDPISRKRELIFEKGDDLHGVFATEDAVHAIDAKNHILFSYDGTKVTKKKFEGAFANRHLNDIVMHNGHAWATCFGLGLLRDDKVIHGIYHDKQPHSPAIYGADWYYCASMKNRLVTRDRHVDLGAFTRGLLIDEHDIYCGLSRNRNNGDNQSGGVAIVDRENLEHMETIDLPCLEVYALCQV